MKELLINYPIVKKKKIIGLTLDSKSGLNVQKYIISSKV